MTDNEHLEGEPLVSVRDVPDEATATLLCEFLKSQGIEATAAPVQISWFSTVETMHHGYWGHVEVLGRDAERARALLEEYMNATPQSDPSPETP